MAKSLVIVESPAKAKTIGKYLGNQYIVKASLGHIKDLPKKDLAVAVDADFRPDYQVIEGKKKLISELKAAAKAISQKLGFLTMIGKTALIGTGAAGAAPAGSFIPRGGSLTTSRNMGAIRIPAMPTVRNASRQPIVCAI